MSYLESQQISPDLEGNLTKTFQMDSPSLFHSLTTSVYANAHMCTAEHNLWLTV